MPMIVNIHPSVEYLVLCIKLVDFHKMIGVTL